MKKSDLDKYNPKADDMTDFVFFNRGNLASEPKTNKNNFSFWLPFFIFFIILLILLFKSTYYLNNFGNSLSALAISLALILLISTSLAKIIQFIIQKTITH